MKKLLLCTLFLISLVNATTVVKNTKKVAIGSTFSVVVSDNSASTGYVWNIILTPALTNEHVTYQSTLVQQPAQAMPGAPSKREFIFKANKGGTYPIFIQKWRPWSADVVEVQQYNVTIE